MNAIALKSNDKIIPHHGDDFIRRISFSDNEISSSYSSEKLFEIPKFSEHIFNNTKNYFTSVVIDSCQAPCEKMIYYDRSSNYFGFSPFVINGFERNETEKELIEKILKKLKKIDISLKQQYPDSNPENLVVCIILQPHNVLVSSNPFEFMNIFSNNFGKTQILFTSKINDNSFEDYYESFLMDSSDSFGESDLGRPDATFHKMFAGYLNSLIYFLEDFLKNVKKNFFIFINLF